MDSFSHFSVFDNSCPNISSLQHQIQWWEDITFNMVSNTKNLPLILNNLPLPQWWEDITLILISNIKNLPLMLNNSSFYLKGWIIWTVHQIQWWKVYFDTLFWYFVDFFEIYIKVVGVHQIQFALTLSVHQIQFALTLF